LYVPNSGSDDISPYILDPATGIPTPVRGSDFPAGASPSSITVEPLNPPGGPTIVIAANKGSNNVSVFSVAGDGSLTPVPGSPFPAGTVPSAVAPNYDFYPVPFVFVANSQSNDVSIYRIDDTTGVLTPLAGSPFPVGSGPSSIVVGGTDYEIISGNLFVYVSNAGSNDMSVFSINVAGGALTPVPGSPFGLGPSPRSILYSEVPQ
jgi:6-phosphogluconolactonase